MNRLTAIEAIKLVRRFGPQAVLRGLDLAVAEGECVALVGANGAGKTTLLRCLAGILRPNDGEVRWLGRPAGTECSSRRLIGMAAHESFLYPHLTARENLLFAARMYDVPQPRQRADDLLVSAGLSRYADRPASRLSKGMRQRLAVLRSIVHDPAVVLLDEPFSGLDDEGTAWLAGLFTELRGRDRTVCFSTHDPAMLRLADRVVRVERGRAEEVSPVHPHVPLPSTRAA